MSYNGSGVYTLPGAQLANGEVVSATENNQFRNDVATALNTAWTRDGQAPATNNIPMGSHKFTGLAAGTSNGDSVRYEQVTSAAAITGGTISGVTISSSTISSLSADLAIVDGGTGASSVAGAKTNFGFVDITSSETIGGVKTFSSQPVFDAGVSLGSNGQIVFPATQNPSSNANTLDDYEEGTFSPTISGGTTAGTCNYDYQQAKYVKIGRGVYFNIFIGWNSHTGTGQINIGNLPFTQPSNSGLPNYVIRLGDVPSTYDYVTANPATGSTTNIIVSQRNPASGGLSNVNLDADGNIAISGFYQVS